MIHAVRNFGFNWGMSWPSSYRAHDRRRVYRRVKATCEVPARSERFDETGFRPVIHADS